MIYILYKKYGSYSVLKHYANISQSSIDLYLDIKKSDVDKYRWIESYTTSKYLKDKSNGSNVVVIYNDMVKCLDNKPELDQEVLRYKSDLRSQKIDHILNDSGLCK